MQTLKSFRIISIFCFISMLSGGDYALSGGDYAFAHPYLRNIPSNPAIVAAQEAGATGATSGVGGGGSSGGYLCEFGFDCVDHIGEATAPMLTATTGIETVAKQTPELNGYRKTAIGSMEKCIAISQKAKAVCLPPLAPGLAGAMMAAQIGISGLRTVSGTSGVCSKLGELAKKAELAMTAYNTACGAAAAACSVQCKETASLVVSSAPKHYIGIIETAAAEAGTAAGAMQTACMTYTKNLAALGVGLVTQKMQAHMGDECKKATSVTSVTRDCSDPNEARNNIACICEINPRAAGCPGSAARGDVAKAQGNSTPTASGALPNSANTKNSGSDSMAKASGASSGAGSGGPAAGGGSGAGAGSVMDGALPGNSQAKLKASGLDANILAGEWSGGGGGRAGGGGYNFEDPASARYKAFMPGGAKDPVRQLASDPYAGQVTGAGGKSNFDKISERYSETRSSLLSQ